MLVFIILLGALLIWYFVKIRPRTKSPDLGNLVLVNGGLKSGKSTFSAYYAVTQFQRALSRWKRDVLITNIFNLFRKDKKPLPEKPLLYSNIPLRGVEYVQLTDELLTRQKRFAYKSVAYLDEASLVADKMLFKWAVADENLCKFCKLFAHETHGGCLILNTQSMGDLSVSLRRNVSSYLYIHRLVKWIPFILVALVREERYSEDNAAISNVYDSDVEDSMKYVIFSKSVWKMFDCYCYSKLTDHLLVEDSVQPPPDDLRTDYIINLKGDKKHEKN